MTETTAFDAWCLIELFGHTKLVGHVTETTVGGCNFIRVDVPEVEGNPAFTRYLSQGAIYSMTPIAEILARKMVEQMRPRPVSVWDLPQESLPAPDEDDEEIPV